MAQKASRIVKCPICGLEFHARGLFGHMRLLHEIVVTTTTNIKSIDTSLNDSSRTHNDLSHDKLSKGKIDLSHPSEATKQPVAIETEEIMTRTSRQEFIVPTPIMEDVVLRQKIGCLGFTMYSRYERLIFFNEKQANIYAKHISHRKGLMIDYLRGSDPDIIIEGREIFRYKN